MGSPKYHMLFSQDLQNVSLIFTKLLLHFLLKAEILFFIWSILKVRFLSELLTL